MGSVVVLGSANVDLVYRVQRIPGPGETVLATGASRAAGGKGQNQAVAASRSGAATTMIAAIGRDDEATFVLASLAEAGVDTTLVRPTSEPTGTALIAVDDAAENSIIVNAAANSRLLGLLDSELAALAVADVVVAQLEIPLETVLAGARAVRAAGGRFVLNAAPIQPLPVELLALVDVLIVNEHEAASLGTSANAVPVVIETRGSQGAELRVAGTAPVMIPTPRVTPVDTTGAGDTFVGALAAMLADGAELDAAARFAVVAASISVERPGAVPSIPTRAEVEARLG